MIVFDDRIADMLSNKKINPIIIELFIRGRKLNISLVFMTQSYFAVPRNIRLNSTCYFIMKISKKKTFNKPHLIIHWILTFKTYIKAIFVLVVDTTLASDNTSHFRKNLLKKNITTNHDN